MPKHNNHTLSDEPLEQVREAYSTDLNPSERFWKHLKVATCANHLSTYLDHPLQSVYDFIASHNAFDSDWQLSFSKHF
jgi:hypothetical protein